MIERPTATPAGNTARPAVLIPFDRREAMTVQAAGKLAGRSPETIRAWCERHAIGRKVVGAWAVSRPALAMLLDDNVPALRAYLAGDRASPLVVGYFHRVGLAALCGPAGCPENQKSGNSQVLRPDL